MRRIDTETLKRNNPVEEIIGRYGIELRPSGRALVGRCPFHDDGGRPNFHVYPFTDSWYCYRCSVGGDVISFVERIDEVGFRDAVKQLGGEERAERYRVRQRARRANTSGNRTTVRGPDERACLAAAVDLYHNRLLTESAALDYVEGRGLDRSIIDRCRLGYVAGDELADYLRWRHLPLGAAMRAGLLGRDGREFLAGRVVVPEIRDGQPIWLIGRTIEHDDGRPKYLGLPGRKPLLGWEGAKDSPEAFLVEGVFDWLTLVNWGYPAVALVGTQAGVRVMKALARFERVYLLLDNDEAGQTAAEVLADELGSGATVITMSEVKDVAELATRQNGRKILIHRLEYCNDAKAA